MSSTASTASASLSARPVSFAERAVLASFAALPLGRLQLDLPDGSVRIFGDPALATADLAPHVTNHASLRVRRPAFFKKCLLHGDIGFAESFIDGDWETPDLTAVVAWFVLNHRQAPTLSGSHHARSLVLNFLRFADRLGHLLRPNDRATARRNIAEHYDLSNDFFALWLDESMMYSAARWERADATLREAQDAKNDALCRHLRLQPTDHVLEIGTGWGGWSIHAASRYGCRVTTVTISRQQHDLAVKRIAAAGLADRIEVRMQDYRDITGAFDKIVSIEMLEAVGHQYLPDYAAACHRLLKPDGLLALQFITVPDHRYAALRSGVDFIQKHIFPGSLLLSVNRLNSLLSEKGGFVLHAFDDFGSDYAQTLRAWRASFAAKLDQVRALGFDERFIRKWHYYLCYCEAAFALRHISVVHTLHSRANNLALSSRA
ncbi:Cyclopropane-fatty-acyl-phospholipid synthase [Lacunisphaera limnophila]|uniref:Cyclopropane-fatty-acyl-phospholipid synthase n=1 Tax=Lacunisphaera limnophila TaxID=1838286 RepID=A0A1D8ASP0_9BACT|nr:cyclopropane-fatty-acyl-phospholipid synthase family protein [Lacunisphaera limnophila]AOS43907.1 Cyclopropane-fatty-acyl-phospholipid synthase [Lacunisphaera limnophila]